MKTCTKCNTAKERTEFHAQASSRDGLQRLCTECQCDAMNTLRADKRAFIVNNVGSSCDDCGSTWTIEFDHTNPATKHPALRHKRPDGVDSQSLVSLSWSDLEAEVAHLQPLCKPCHRKKTSVEATSRAKARR